jgi:hypothetical protein
MVNKFHNLISILLFLTFGSAAFLTNVQLSKIETKENATSDTILTTIKENPINLKVNFGILPANASGYVTYKVSSLSGSDFNSFCKAEYNSFGGYRTTDGRYALCYRNWSYENRYVQFDEVCEYKHPGWQTWAGDNGKSCYDSYWKW